ncbi:transcriptional regulator [Desulfolithobacter dissulfuricans]|uniref:Transcriptional regulator n=1 Tax=Desulfolithobacter dissulfuricans TaxID=2795293 RepID=A0A915XKG4_9BACT|nr:metalloregulator ArsR/SmtB family transcription factor [Desulfolithobacter dissulfuricans]BCO09178.1 transcriptional regulator [Desulfolithobacter dissulfuricans]
MKDTAALFKALSEEIRLRILVLLTRGELCVCDLMEVLDLPQSTISRHLAYLRHAGWVEGRRQGVWMYYRLARGTTPFQEGLAEFLIQSLPNLDTARQDLENLESHLQQKDHGNCR